MLVALSAAAVFVTLLFVSASPAAISLTDGGANIAFAASRTQLLPQNCAKFEWAIDHTQAVYFNGQGVTGSGSREQCSPSDVSATLQVIYRDGSTHNFTLSVWMLLHRESGFALLSCGLLIVAFAIALFVLAPIDYLLLTLLIFIPSIPLFLLRDTPLFENNMVQAVFWIAWLATAGVWIRRGGKQLSYKPRAKANFFNIMTVCGLLLIFTDLGYYRPMKQHFYVGSGDEAYHLMIGGRPIWSASRDDYQARPYEDLQVDMAYLSSPDSVDGFLWQAFLERFLVAVLIFALARKFFGVRSAVPMIAAILYTVWPAEFMRYLAVEIPNYMLSAFLFILAVTLYVHSYRRGQRWLLASACFVLGIGLLTLESALPLAVFVPLLLLLSSRQRYLMQWIYLWLATVGLLGIRLVFYILSFPSYQASTLTRQSPLANLPSNVWHLGIAPLFSFLQYPGSLLTFGAYSLLVAAVAVVIVWRYARPQPLPRRCYVVALVVGGAALCLCVVPYFPLAATSGDFATQPLTRSQYFATHFQVFLWAVVIELVGTWLVSRTRRMWLVAVTTAIVILSMTSNLQFQANRGFMNHHITFEGLGQAFQGLQSQLAGIPPDAVILVNIGDGVESPFGLDWHLIYMSCVLFNHAAFQGKFFADGFVIRSDDHPPYVQYKDPPMVFNHAIVVNVTSDWHLSAEPMPAITPSKKTIPGPISCAELADGSPFWPPVSSYTGPGLRYFH